jgi:hypothetical protein
MLTGSYTFKAILGLLPLTAAGFLLPSTAPAQTPAENCSSPTPPPAGPNGASPGNGQDLSKKLDRCNGELKAPHVGDGKMVEPAPDTGNSRIVTPGELPSNANPSNGSKG